MKVLKITTGFEIFSNKIPRNICRFYREILEDIKLSTIVVIFSALAITDSTYIYGGNDTSKVCYLFY